MIHYLRKSLFLFFLFISVFGQAQTGPGGVEDVSGTSNLTMWLDANTISQTNGTNISSWTDQSGYGNTANAVSGNEPVFQTNVLNGFPVVRFTASNTDYLRVSDAASLNPDKIFIAIVASYTSSSIKWSPFLIKTNNYSQWSKGYGIARNNSNAQQIAFVTAYNVNDVIASLSYNTPTILTLNYDKVNVELYNNESLLGTDNYTSNIENTTNYLYLGISPNASSGIGTGVQNPLDGDIAEVIIINRNVNSAERIIIHNYLAAKYGLTLASNDKYAGNYDDNVIGIGAESSGSHTKSNDGKGLTIEQNTGFANGEYLFAGNNVETNENLYTDISGVTGLKARWKRIWYFDITGSGNETVNLTFDISEGGFSGNAGSPASNYKLLYRSSTSGNWTDAGTASSINGDQITFSNNSLSNGDGYYTIGTLDYDNSPLPIQLLSFDAVKQDLNVLLNWQTATETNNDFFTIERSQNGKDWEALTQVKGAGNSNEIRSYHYADHSPLPEMSYYRLKQTDYDGSFDYSSVRKVELQQKAELKVYPNPTQSSITIEGYIQTPQSIQILNSVGQEFSSSIHMLRLDSTSVKIDLSALPVGVYFIRLNDEMIKVFKN